VLHERWVKDERRSFQRWFGIAPTPSMMAVYGSTSAFFIFEKGIFDGIEENEDPVNGPFHRLVEEKQPIGCTYEGIWASIDTFKKK
jgi:hypothetical protein